MIGISTYFSEFDLPFLKKAVNMGIKSIFTTVVMPEENYDSGEFKSKLSEIMTISKENNIELITDISERVYRNLGIQDVKELNGLGFRSVRIDSGFKSPEELKKLTETFHVYLNGSHVTAEQLESFRTYGISMNNISIMHNFYPKVGSGFDSDLFKKVNKEFKEFGVRIVAFIPGDKRLRGPVFSGLPTLEKHRGIAPFVSYLELIQMGIDDVFIGDISVGEDTLKLIVNHSKDSIVRIPSRLLPNYQTLYFKKLVLRDDLSQDIFRVNLNSFKYDDVSPSNLLSRRKGTITVDNFLAKRYQGEINICRKELPFDNKVNTIGNIHLEFIDLLNYISRDTNIMVVPDSEEVE